MSIKQTTGLMLAGFVFFVATPSYAQNLIEPHMHIAARSAGAPKVAITLDACSGATDWRILDVLIANRIPATIFATSRWMRGNAKALKTLRAHPDLFEIEDHGAEHVPAVIGSERPYGLKPAGTRAAVQAEVLGGAQAIGSATGIAPTWYRDATALYSPDAMALISSLGFKVAGFSLNGDLGASVSANTARARINKARDGDVIISHINQPKRPSGMGVAQGFLDLQAKGVDFVLLRDVGAFAP